MHPYLHRYTLQHYFSLSLLISFVLQFLLFLLSWPHLTPSISSLSLTSTPISPQSSVFYCLLTFFRFPSNLSSSVHCHFVSQRSGVGLSDPPPHCSFINSFLSLLVPSSASVTTLHLFKFYVAQVNKYLWPTDFTFPPSISPCYQCSPYQISSTLLDIHSSQCFYPPSLSPLLLFSSTQPSSKSSFSIPPVILSPPSCSHHP